MIVREDLLAGDEQQILLAQARRSIESRLAGRPAPVQTDAPPRLRRPQAAFVTLRRGGALRGCIGVVTAEMPLIEAVAECAEAAAFRDPRFPPVEDAEMAEITIEISALAVPAPLREPAEIVIGRDGLMVSLGERRGLLLPQVAIEQGWDRERFLQETCRKAGLDPRAWQRGALVEVFSAQVFSERDPLSAPRPGSPP